MGRDFRAGGDHALANIRSAVKRARQAEGRRLRNRAVKNTVRTRVRRFFEKVEAKDREAVSEELRRSFSAIDKAVKKGVLHPNTAARRKSRIMKAHAALAAAAQKKRKPRKTEKTAE